MGPEQCCSPRRIVELIQHYNPTALTTSLDFDMSSLPNYCLACTLAIQESRLWSLTGIQRTLLIHSWRRPRIKPPIVFAHAGARQRIRFRFVMTPYLDIRKTPTCNNYKEQGQG